MTEHEHTEPTVAVQRPRNRPRRPWPWAAGAAILGLIVGYAVGSTDTTEPTTPVADTDTTETDSVLDRMGEEVAESARQRNATHTPKPEPPPVVLPEPDGRTVGRCDSLLGDSDGDDRYKFIASVDAENTGNIGLVVDVWVRFNQLGAEPVRYSETVEIPVGETITVHFDESVTRDQWRRYTDAGRECDIGGDMVDTFGDPE
jgi:hypothetical protein